MAYRAWSVCEDNTAYDEVDLADAMIAAIAKTRAMPCAGSWQRLTYCATNLLATLVLRR